MTAPRTVAEVLDAAADLLTPEGAWTQGELAKYAGGKVSCLCALGAVFETRGGAIFDAIDFIDGLLPQTKPGDLRPIAAFNDAPGRTQAEVIAKLRELAALAREQGK